MIPKFPLKNDQGQPVSFDIQRWGAFESYDHVKAHRHHFHEICVFEQGRATHDIDFTTIPARKGSVHFVASDNVHLLLREDRSRGFSILFTDSFFPYEVLAQLPFNAKHPALTLSAPDLAYIRIITEQIQTEMSATRTFSDKIIRSLMDVIMLVLTRASQQQKGVVVQSSLPPALSEFRKLVNAHLKDHYRVADYASSLNVTTKHLIQMHKKHTGNTPLKYIQEQLIGISKRLLYDSDQSVKEIAYELNFSDAPTFSKYFKSVTGYSPLAYRAKGK